LIRNFWWSIPLERGDYLSEAEALLSSDAYTNGSLVEGRAVYGVFSEELDLKEFFALEAFASVFRTEVHAILSCSEYGLEKCMSGKTICICSDSRATLLALSSHTVSSKLVLQYWSSVQGLSTHNRVQLIFQMR
jgi:hypothetical protein